MTSPVTINLSEGAPTSLECVCKILREYHGHDYFAYEKEATWYLGIDSIASLTLNPSGHACTIDLDGQVTTTKVKDQFTSVMDQFSAPFIASGKKIFGYVSFSYAAFSRGLDFKLGKWPLVSLVVPRLLVEITSTYVSIQNHDEGDIRLINRAVDPGVPYPAPSTTDTIDLNQHDAEYKKNVQLALAEIERNLYDKVIASRAIQIPCRIDPVGTLFQGRQALTPKRAFCFHQAGREVTGFSPELVVSIRDGRILTEPLAGTRSNEGSAEERMKLRTDLLTDPKEIVEHVISVKECISELDQLCPSEQVVVQDLMSVRERGKVQHLGSTVAGALDPVKSVWDAFNVLFPSVTASGIPKVKALEAIERLEGSARDAYAGAVLLFDKADSFEAALVLRSVFQDEEGAWLQAGAGIISASKPARELEETREKLLSVAGFIAPVSKSQPD